MTLDNGETHYSIKATERSLSIVDEIRQRNGAGVSELADHFEVSKSTIHNHLATLTKTGYLYRDGDEYKAGLRFLTVGGHARNQMQIYKLAREEIDDLAAETGETAKVVVEQNGKAIYLYQSRGSKGIRTDVHVGTRAYLHTSAVGKAILSQLPRERVEDIISKWGLPKQTNQTISDKDVLYEKLDQIRRQGYATDTGERIPGLRCIGSAIVSNNEILGAVSVSGPMKRLNHEDDIEKLSDLVKSTASVIEIKSQHGYY